MCACALGTYVIELRSTLRDERVRTRGLRRLRSWSARALARAADIAPDCCRVTAHLSFCARDQLICELILGALDDVSALIGARRSYTPSQTRWLAIASSYALLSGFRRSANTQCNVGTSCLTLLIRRARTHVHVLRMCDTIRLKLYYASDKASELACGEARARARSAR